MSTSELMPSLMRNFLVRVSLSKHDLGLRFVSHKLPKVFQKFILESAVLFSQEFTTFHGLSADTHAQIKTLQKKNNLNV